MCSKPLSLFDSVSASVHENRIAPISSDCSKSRILSEVKIRSYSLRYIGHDILVWFLITTTVRGLDKKVFCLLYSVYVEITRKSFCNLESQFFFCHTLANFQLYSTPNISYVPLKLFCCGPDCGKCQHVGND